MKGLDPRQAFRGVPPPEHTRWVLPLGALATLSVLVVLEELGAGILLPVVELGVGILAFVWGLSVRWVVGSDGIEVKGLFRRRFIHFREIARIVPEGRHAIRLSLGSGEDVTLVTGSPSDPKVRVMKRTQERRDAAYASMATALHAFWEGEQGPPAAVALLARGGRRPSGWSGALRELAGAREAYRSAAVPMNDLLAVVSDLRAPDDARVAAALVLARSGDGRIGERIRVAAASTVSPDLRLALAVASAGDDQALTVAARADRN